MTDAQSAYVRSRLRRITRPVAALVLLLALLSLSDALGWTSVWGAGGHSRANAALAIAVAALGILSWRSGGSRARRGFVVGCGVFVALLAGATLFEWVSGQALGIDALLAPGSVSALPGEVRMAPTTALCLFLAGLVLATPEVKRPRLAALATAAASAIVFIVALALIGALYGVGSELGAARYTTEMALASAVTLPLLSLALQSLRPELGLLGLVTEPGPAGILTRWLLVPAMVVPVAVGWVVRAAELSNPLSDALTAITHVVVFVALTVLGARAVLRQDRARLAAERGLRAANDALEARVLARTADLTRANEELERARAEAVSAMRARSDFLARMSHEIRTPLNGVLGMIALTNDTALTDEQRELLATADASATQLLGLVEDILDFAKIDAGKLRLDRAPFSLEDALSGAIRGLAQGAHAKGLALRVDIEPAVPDALVGDPKRLQQVIINLVANAIRFTEAGEVILQVRVAPATSGGEIALIFRVIDTGIGIAPEMQAKIFEAFTQSEAPTARKYGGTGLGLAICSELTHLMGGTIGVESTPGHGSTFTFAARFGAASDAPMPATGSAAGLSMPRPGVRAARSLEVLVVDDNAINARVATVALERLGHRLVVAGSGREALARLARGGIDIVLMDVQMPEMDGLEATRAIRAAEAPRHEHLAIIGLTAQALAGDAERCLAAGMDAYLPKPIDLPRLARVIEELAAKYPATARAQAVAEPAPPECMGGEGEPPLARAELVARLGDDDALATEVVALFFAELPAARAALQRALEAADPAGVTRAAHNLLGALLNVAAGPAARAARTLEQAGALADDTRPARMDAAARALDLELDRLKVAMDAMDTIDAHAGAALRRDTPRAPVGGP